MWTGRSSFPGPSPRPMFRPRANGPIACTASINFSWFTLSQIGISNASRTVIEEARDVLVLNRTADPDLPLESRHRLGPTLPGGQHLDDHQWASALARLEEELLAKLLHDLVGADVSNGHGVLFVLREG